MKWRTASEATKMTRETTDYLRNNYPLQVVLSHKCRGAKDVFIAVLGTWQRGCRLEAC